MRLDARAISVCLSEQCVGEQVVDDGNFRVSLQRLLVKPGARLILSGRDARHPQTGIALRKLRVQLDGVIEGLSRFAVLAHLQVGQPQRQPQPD